MAPSRRQTAAAAQIGPNWSGRYPPDFVDAEIAQSPSDMMCVGARVALTDDTPEELKAANAGPDHRHFTQPVDEK